MPKRKKQRNAGVKEERNEKEKDKQVGSVTMTAKERMKRATREAAEEDGTDVDFAEESEEEWHGIGTLGGAGEEGAVLLSAKHLPDHIFTAAAAASSQPSPQKVESVLDSASKKKNKSKAKQRIVGSRIIRTLPSSPGGSLSASLTLPPARINKFLQRTLRLKQAGGGNAQVKSSTRGPEQWERRPVNIGVMRSIDAPARRFMRGT
ncbi:hypothetical protein K439DRAFT_1642279 [Ramaria rubella]|nr:hypothetical protein K439DRAFT_1642279 [Ramaria rubella]